MKINHLLADQFKIGDLINEGEEKYQLKMIKTPEFRKIAENILWLTESTYFESYNTMTNLDKQLVYAYWIKIDGEPNEVRSEEYLDWFLHKATSSDDISRARRWLLEHQFILVKPEVAKRAQDAGLKRARSF
jgi:hypothetical protein